MKYATFRYGTVEVENRLKANHGSRVQLRGTMQMKAFRLNKYENYGNVLL